jgi:hypothetical protein
MKLIVVPRGPSSHIKERVGHLLKVNSTNSFYNYYSFSNHALYPISMPNRNKIHKPVGRSTPRDTRGTKRPSSTKRRPATTWCVGDQDPKADDPRADDPKRQESAMELLGGITKIYDGCWSVQSNNTEELFTVELDLLHNMEFSCNCMDLQNQGEVCKHISAVLKHRSPKVDLRNPEAPVTIDLTEDEDDVAAAGPEVGLAEDRTPDEQVARRNVRSRLSEIRRQLQRVCFMDETPLQLLELAVGCALKHESAKFYLFMGTDKYTVKYNSGTPITNWTDEEFEEWD